MDSSLETDSPNTVDKRRFGVVGGHVTEEERNFCIRNGLMELGEDGEYHELSTLMESMVDASTDEDDDEEIENKEPAVEPVIVDVAVSSLIQLKEDSLVEKSLNKSKSKPRTNKKFSMNCTAEADDSVAGIGTSNHSMQLRSACRKNESFTSTTSTTTTIRSTPARILRSAGTNSNPQSPVILHFTNNPPAAAATPTATGMATPGGSHRLPLGKVKTPGQGPSASTPVLSSKPQMAPLLPLLETTDCSDNQTLSTIQCPATFCSPLSIDSPSAGINEQESLSAMRLPALFQTPAVPALSPSSRKKLNATVNFIDVSYGDVGDQIAEAASDSDLTVPPGGDGELADTSTTTKTTLEATIDKIPRRLILEDISNDSIDFDADVEIEPQPQSEPQNIEIAAPTESAEIECGSSPIVGIIEEADDLLVDAVPSETASVSFSLELVKNVDGSLLLMEDIEEIISEAANAVNVNGSFSVQFQDQDHNQSVLKSSIIPLLIDGIEDETAEVSDAAGDGSACSDAGTGAGPKTEFALDKENTVNTSVEQHQDDDVDADADLILEEYAVSPISSNSNSFKGIDAISPSCVAEDISLNDTADSLADISLDDISNDSFNLETGGEVNVNVLVVGVGGENLGDSFATCASRSSNTNTSYGTCEDEEFQRGQRSFADRSRASGSSRASGQRDSRSFEDLDDTITLMEKLLHQADQLEEQEMLEQDSKLGVMEPVFENENENEPMDSSISELELGYSKIPHLATSLTPRRLESTGNENMDPVGFPEMLSSPSLFDNSITTPIKSTVHSKANEKETVFATPAGPAPKAKNLVINSTSPKGTYSMATASSQYKIKPKVGGKSPAGETPNSPCRPRNSPSPVKVKSDLLSSPSTLTSPLRNKVVAAAGSGTGGGSAVASPSKLGLQSPGDGQVKQIPKVKVTPKRLRSILDSPGSRAPGVPIVTLKKLNSPKAQKTPGKKPLILPISSPVANYIHSVPTPTQIKRVHPHPPKSQPPPPPSPFTGTGASKDRAASHDESLDLNSTSSSAKTCQIPRPKSSLPVPSGGKVRLSQHFRAGTNKDGMGVTKLKELTPKFYVGPDQIKPVSGSGTFGTPCPSLGSSKTGEITPVSQRHLGKRDSNNASMVNQQAVTRKFCPERFGFQTHK